MRWVLMVALALAPTGAGSTGASARCVGGDTHAVTVSTSYQSGAQAEYMTVSVSIDGVRRATLGRQAFVPARSSYDPTSTLPVGAGVHEIGVRWRGFSAGRSIPWTATWRQQQECGP